MLGLTPPRLETPRLEVRMADTGDSAAVHDYFSRNRAFHAPWSPLGSDEMFALEYFEKRIPALRREFAEGTRASFFFLPRGGDRVIGHAQLSGFMRGPAQFCYLGYAICEGAQGHGYMEEGLRAIIDYAFGPLRLHRIMANYMPHNQRSGALLRRLGFTPEGYARDYLQIAGNWEDHILTSLTNPDWQPPA